MYREIGSILAVIVLFRLIVFKYDQQVVILLEGKLFRQKRDVDIAAKVYEAHKSALSLALLMIGGAATGVSVFLLANGHRLFPLSAAISLALVGFGTWGRLRSFLAADLELGERSPGHTR